ncbi:hypothetical protein DEO48_13590 [Enterobacter sp. CGMCC 5087]|uniref:hypothetical protein n=1 Tax=Enterobacter sp. CGMCC 5087 TaxID=2183878 RepID=UPI000D6808FD|nr:hypothetical protein [Enterobacter sp. CGMCC 5087]PWI79493.1 hypothetical protein DEO48_13590 [Enterobacter sp. CGMCC 5087]
MKPSYEELEAKCAALAAENAGLKDAAEFATASDMWEELGVNVMRYQYQEWYADRLKSAMETPATDAFLAEVRAQESSPLVRALTVIANSEQHDGETVVCDFDTLISVAAGALRDHYAAQLRKGVQS